MEQSICHSGMFLASCIQFFLTSQFQPCRNSPLAAGFGSWLDSLNDITNNVCLIVAIDACNGADLTQRDLGTRLWPIFRQDLSGP